MNRRQLLLAAAGASLARALPAWAQPAGGAEAGRLPAVSGEDIRLTVGHGSVPLPGGAAHAVSINGTTPGPLIRLREGQTVRIQLANTLAEDTSLHWHGLLVPFQMDGVPGITFPGVKPGETFAYDFPVKQSGTYWYHSHSGLQEPEGCYGPIIIDPAGADPVAYDREHVVVLGDFSRTHPHHIFKRLKQQSGLYNFQKQTVQSLLEGRDQTLAERLQWARMRMDPTDIADVTGAVYTYVINGQPPGEWTGLFTPGERVRLRFINAAAQTIFNVRIPGLKLTVVQADGQHVRPVEVDEFQIGNAETYDVIVQPAGDQAYALVAETIDRFGMAHGLLAPRLGMSAPVPPLRQRPLTTMRDMGMDHGAMGHAGHETGTAAPADPHAGHMMHMDHAAGHMMHMDHAAGAAAAAPGMAPPKPRGSDVMAGSMAMRDGSRAPQVAMTPGVQMIAPAPTDRTGEPGQGLESVGHRVLVYRDLVALEPNPDRRPPSRALEIHLTGNMERFMWGFDGRKYSDRPAPYPFAAGERVRVTLVNDTMMTHPIHLHGHFMELVHGPVGFLPRKHTVNVLPGGKVTFDFTAEAGDWAFHCHMLFHMHAGMFQVFAIRPEGQA